MPPVWRHIWSRGSQAGMTANIDFAADGPRLTPFYTLGGKQRNWSLGTESRWRSLWTSPTPSIPSCGGKSWRLCAFSKCQSTSGGFFCVQVALLPPRGTAGNMSAALAWGCSPRARRAWLNGVRRRRNETAHSPSSVHRLTA